jgi:hypothetical protein
MRSLKSSVQGCAPGVGAAGTQPGVVLRSDRSASGPPRTIHCDAKRPDPAARMSSSAPPSTSAAPVPTAIALMSRCRHPCSLLAGMPAGSRAGPLRARLPTRRARSANRREGGDPHQVGHGPRRGLSGAATPGATRDSVRGIQARQWPLRELRALFGFRSHRSGSGARVIRLTLRSDTRMQLARRRQNSKGSPEMLTL